MPFRHAARLLSISVTFQIIVRDDYFFSIVFSNRNPDAINTAKTNTIVYIFLPFLFFKLNNSLCLTAWAVT